MHNVKSCFLQLFIMFSCVFGVLAEVSAQPDGRQQAGRVLSFPKDRSLGRIMLQDSNSSRGLTASHYSENGFDWNETAEYLGEAQGDVVIPAGKIAGLFVENAGLKDLSPLADIPPDSIYMVSFGFQPVGNECMKHISHLSGLKELRLSGSKITSDGLKYMTKLQSLERLTLPDGTTNRGLYFAAKIKTLKGLSLMKSRATAKGMEILAKMESLEELGIHSEHLGNNDLRHLADMKSLKCLRYAGKNFGDASLDHIRKIPTLKILTLMYLPITDAGVARLSGHKTLEYLNLSKTNITNGCIKYFKTMPSIKKLYLRTETGGRGNYPISDEAMPQLAQLVNLEHLELPNHGITDRGMSHITKLKNLEYLWVCGSSNSPLTDKSLQYVSELKKLDHLLIRGNGFTDAGMEYLTGLGNLKDLTIGGKLITDAGIVHLSGLTNMTRLSLSSPSISDRSIASFSGMKRLTSLNIEGSFTDKGLSNLKGFKALNYIRVKSSGKLSPEATKELKDSLPDVRSKRFIIQSRKLKNKPKASTVKAISQKPAPIFAGKTLDGKEIKLEDYRGKVVVLYFWATWCKPCVAGTPKLKNYYSEIKKEFGDNIEMISLSMDRNDNPVRYHVSKFRLSWPQMRIGLNSSISSDYGVNNTVPRYYLIGPDGKFLLGPDSPQVDERTLIRKVLNGK